MRVLGVGQRRLGGGRSGAGGRRMAVVALHPRREAADAEVGARWVTDMGVREQVVECRAADANA